MAMLPPQAAQPMQASPIDPYEEKMAQMRQNVLRQQEIGSEMAALDQNMAGLDSLRAIANPQQAPQSIYGNLAQLIAGSTVRQRENEQNPLRQALEKEQATLAAEKEASVLEQAMADRKRKMEMEDSEAARKAAKDAEGVRQFDLNYKLRERELEQRKRAANARKTPTKGLDKVALRELDDEARSLRKFTGIAEDFNPNYTQFGGLKTKVLNKLVAAGSQNDINELIASEDFDAETKEALQWWGRFRRDFELVKRHDLFGAALTGGEEASWNDAVGVLMGMDGKEAQKSLVATLNTMRDDMVTGSEIYLADGNDISKKQYAKAMKRVGGKMGEDGTYYFDPFQSTKQKAQAADQAVVQQIGQLGLSESDMALVNTLSPADRKAFLEEGGDRDANLMYLRQQGSENAIWDAKQQERLANLKRTQPKGYPGAYKKYLREKAERGIE